MYSHHHAEEVVQPPVRCFLALSAIAGLGCSGVTSPEVVCTAEMRAGIVVEIHDGSTGAALAYDARGIVRDGAYADSLHPAMSSSADPHDLYARAAAHERAGTYTIEVVHPDYATWTAAGVRVEDGACHVQTITLHANLTPTS
jgi:hypothetical protein